jgi:hypothetical protein
MIVVFENIFIEQPRMSANASSNTKQSKIYTRNNLKWTTAEDKRLEELYTKEKYTFKKIATDLHRSLDAIQARFVKQVLCNKYSPRYLLDNKEALAKHHDINLDNFIMYLKYAGIKEQEPKIVKTRKNRTKHFKYEMEEYDDETDDEAWEPDTSDSSDSSDEDSYLTDTSSDESDDMQEEQHYIHNYILQKQKERKEMQEKLNNIMKYLEMLNEKIDRLDKKYK